MRSAGRDIWMAGISLEQAFDLSRPLLMFSSFTGSGNDAKDAVMKTEVHTGGIHDCIHGWINFGSCLNKE